MRSSPKIQTSQTLAGEGRVGARNLYIWAVSRLVLDDDGGPVPGPVPEGRHRTVGHIHATAGAAVEVGAGAVPGAPGRVVDEVAASDELHRPVGPRRRVPPGAAVGPGRDHFVGRVAGEDA